MKLIHHTISKLSIVMIIILTFWAGFFFYSILDEILDETDDSLENYKHLIIQQVLRDTAAINNSSDLMSQYFIKEIPEEEAIHYKERYFDSTRFYELEYDFDPVRVLKTAFRGQDKKFYELTIMISTLEQDDMIEAILWSIVILYITLLICILIVSEFVFRKSLAPFYKLLDWLNKFTLGGKNPPLENPTKIKEFRRLNETILKMTRRNEEMYSIHRKRLPRTPDPVGHLPEQAGITGRTTGLHGRATGRNRGHPPESGTYREIEQIPVAPFPYRERSIPRNKRSGTQPDYQRTRGRFSRDLRA